MSERPGEHDQRPDDDVVDVELVRVEAESGAYERYTGKVVNVQPGFCFIGSVRRGTQTIATGGDVFCPMDQFKVGDVVMFDELSADPRHPGKSRTEKAEKVFEIAISEGQTRPVTALALRRAFEAERTAYHARAKAVPEADVDQALENHPFDDALATLAASILAADSTVAGFAKKYLSDDLFAHLQAFGVSYDIDGEVDVAEESHQIEATAAEYEAADMALQASDLREQYRKFAGARRVFHLMHQQGILHIDTVIPIRYLPEFTVACPVWYAEGRDGDVKNQLHEDDPRVSPFVTYLCDQVGSKEFAWFFQLYNRRTRLLSSFQSNRDIMPPKLVKLLGVARQVFDYTAIATPYHGEASRDWQDAKWLRQIDPFLLGFNRDVPFIFILGRWSGTGIFPLFLDMIADTMAHLESHKQLLHNFSVNTYWYRGGNGNSDLLSMGGGQPHPLEPFADQVLAAYREGRLFQFLRGEKPELTAAEK